MNVTKEDINELSAILKVEIKKEDYEKRVKKELKKKQQQAQLRGFRQGKAPLAIIKKMYYNEIMLTEINGLLIEYIDKYLEDNNIELLGQYLPSKEKQPKLNLNKEEDVEFYFDIAYAPKVELKIKGRTIPYYKVKVEEKDIDERIDYLTKTKGKSVDKDIILGEKELVSVSIEKLDEDGNIVEDFVKLEDRKFLIEFIKNEEEKNKFKDKKVGDQVVICAEKTFENDTDRASFFQVSNSEVENIKGNFRLTINNINLYEAAEQNEEFYSEIFGEEVKTEKEFRERIKEEIEAKNQTHSDYRLFLDLMPILEETDITYSEDFLKRLLIEVNKIKPSELEATFEQHKKQFEWQIINYELKKAVNMEATEEDIEDMAVDVLSNNLANMGITEIPKNELEEYTRKNLKEEEKRKFYISMLSEKVANYVRENAKLDIKEVTDEELTSLLEGKNEVLEAKKAEIQTTQAVQTEDVETETT